MRSKFTLVLALVIMASSTAALAVTVPSLPSGVVYLKSRNQDNGTTYVDLDLAAGQTVSLTPSDFNTGNDNRFSFKAPGSLNGEDTWGIALTYHIEADGVITNNGTQVETGAGEIVYDNSAGGQDTWLVAIFYGGVDTSIVLTGGNGVNNNGIPVGDFRETIVSTGVNVKLYAIDKANLAPNVHSDALLPYVDGSHTAPDTYVGWTDNLAGAVLLLEGTSDYFQSTVIVDATGTVVGSGFNASTAYFDLPVNGAGVWNPILGASDELLTPDGTPTNLYFQWTLSESIQGWTVKSNDVGGAYAIPEPMTMGTAFAALAGLAAYLKRRRA